MKYIAVDLGNVICKVDFNIFINELSISLNITSYEVIYFLNRTQKLHDLGLTNIADELRDHFKIKSKKLIDRLIASWNKTVCADKLMLSILKDMVSPSDGSEPVNLALLSNIGLEHAALMPEWLTRKEFD